MSEIYTLTGRVVHIGDVEHVGAKQTAKLNFVVSDEAEKYPQEIQFEAFGKSVDNVQGKIQVGDQVTVNFDLRGRAWKDRWFVSLSAWKVDRLGAKQERGQKADPNQDGFGDTLDEEPPF